MDYKKIKINLNDVNRIKDFIRAVRGFESDVDIMTERAVVDAKSVLGIYGLDLTQDTYVRIISDDVNENRKFETTMEEFK